MSIVIKNGPEAFQYLSGIFTIYKPCYVGYFKTRSLIINKLVEDLNSFEPRPLREKVKITGNFFDKTLSAEKYETLSDHPLVIGPRYQEKDFQVSVFDNIGKYFSGVIPIGISSYGCLLLRKIQKKNLIKEFEIKCRLGIMTENCLENSEIKYKSNYKHLTIQKLNNVISKILSSSTRFAFKSIGVDMHSQKAYDLIEKGPIRPPIKSYPIIYGLKCVEFKAPYIKLVLQIVNEDPEFLKKFVFDLGLSLKTYMCISSVLCTRIGKYTIDDSLLMKNLTIENVIKNIQNIKKITNEMLELDNVNIIKNDFNEEDNYVKKLKLHKYNDENNLFS